MRGLEIVREIGFLYEALNGIMHHHERIDGRGYPMGLAGHEIPEFARVIAVADAFDSMTSTRSYREAKSIDLAIGELRKGAGSQFDPLIVEAFIAALDVEEVAAAGPGDRAGRPRDRDRPGPRRPDGAAAVVRSRDRQHDGRAPGAGADGVLAGAGLGPAAADGGGGDAGHSGVRRDGRAPADSQRARPVHWAAALAFGGFIAFGELLRLALPGGREAAPIAMVGAMSYALLLALPQARRGRTVAPCWSSRSPRSA